jgi:hypothetical protein
VAVDVVLVESQDLGPALLVPFLDRAHRRTVLHGEDGGQGVRRNLGLVLVIVILLGPKAQSKPESNRAQNSVGNRWFEEASHSGN